MSKKDFIRTPDGSNIIVDMNLKAGKSFAVPNGPGFQQGDLPNTNVYLYLKVDPVTSKVTLQMCVAGNIVEFVPKTTLSDVAFSGEYNDLLDKPDLSHFLTSVTWGTVTGKPDFKTVSTTGDYSDLLNKPDLSVYALESDLTTEVSNREDAITVLQNAIAAMANQKYFATTAARDAYNVTTLPFSAFVTDDGDGKWALYQATTTGVNATYVKLSDPDLLNLAYTAAQIAAAYESNPDVNRFTNELRSKLVNLAVVATTGKYSDLIGIPQSLGSTDVPTFGGAKLKGLVQLGAFNLGTFDFTGYYGSAALGYVLVGQNLSNGGGETDFVHARNAIGAGPAYGGFQFYQLNNDGTLKLLLELNGDTGAITIPANLVLGQVADAEEVNSIVVYNSVSKQFEKASPALIGTAVAGRSNIRFLTASATLEIDDDIIFVDCTNGDVTINLMQLSETTDDIKYTIKKVDTTAHIVKILPFSGDSVGTGSEYDITTGGSAVTIISYALTWHPLSKF